MPGAGRAGSAPRRKRFGQHFLHDPAVIARIVQAVAPRPGEHLLEIGPGRGALTGPLLACGAATLDAIEIDRDLAASLRARFAQARELTLHESDALDFDFTALARSRGGPLRVVGNLPYNISTPLLFRLLAHAPALADLTVMLQREVVARLAAAPGGRDYGRLTVMLAPHAEVRQLFAVGPGAFQPPPKVWSAVVHIGMRRAPLFAPSGRYAEVVAAAFAQRRKTLRNALRRLLTAEEIQACGVEPGARPETLAPQAFNTLAQALDRTAR
ncbi:MAG: 16S rRNA (adenine(1518)-N(6)/adenine(1519)-N(6))-dimethyltransferase RsmA [Gammaproteobacteria bacterium]|nr:16S rRNA (adenine(1518)-N(6)/adenine(1519)-N(6))-dimethyltransferase RsmA [Gammaproteobacteria bacterium]